MTKVPEATDIEVGRRVRLRRMAIGISQEKLGEALGVSFQQVQKYEKGTNRIGASRLQAIASTLGVSPAAFFPESGDTSVLDLPSDALTLRVARNFARIPDAGLRRSLAATIAAAAGVEASGAEAA